MSSKSIDPAEALKSVIAAIRDLEPTMRNWVLQSAANMWQITVNPAMGATGATGNPVINSIAGNPSPDVATALAAKDVRAFIRLKKPDTDIERVACLGYFIVKTTGAAGFSAKEVKQAHVDSGGSAMNFPRALDNATRRSKYLSNRGPREKQLTTLGEDVVEALPNREAVANLKHKPARKRKAAKRTAKKVAR
jgi:hypothetical protein